MNTKFSNNPQEVLFGIDNVIVPQLISAIPGGRTLDMTGFAGSTISAGWIIITDGNGAYKPLACTAGVAAAPAEYKVTADTAKQSGKTYYTESAGVYTATTAAWVEGTTYYERTKEAVEAVTEAYAAMPDGWRYAGVLAHSLLASRPAATVMTAGQVNEKAAPNPVALAAIKSAVVAAIPTIQFITEENA